jgi:ribose 5-phosphate isomerase A
MPDPSDGVRAGAAGSGAAVGLGEAGMTPASPEYLQRSRLDAVVAEMREQLLFVDGKGAPFPADKLPHGKIAAAAESLLLIPSGATVGLGSGSTAELMVQILGRVVQAGYLHGLTCVSTSDGITKLAQAGGIVITPLADIDRVDIGIDGADEVADTSNWVIKGGGGCALRERIAADKCARFVIIVDESKCSIYLGDQWAIPIDVKPEKVEELQRKLEAMGAQVTLRMQKPPNQHLVFETDDHNRILDAKFGRIEEPAALAERLKALEPHGFVNHGLFAMPTDVIIAKTDGKVVHKRWQDGAWAVVPAAAV